MLSPAGSVHPMQGGEAGCRALGCPSACCSALSVLSVPVLLVHPERGSVPTTTLCPSVLATCPPHRLSICPSVHPSIHPSHTALGPPVLTHLASYLGCPCLCCLSIHPCTLFCPSPHAMLLAVCLSMSIVPCDSCPMPPLFVPPYNAPSCPSVLPPCCLSIRPICSASPSHAPWCLSVPMCNALSVPPRPAPSSLPGPHAMPSQCHPTTQL